MNSPQETGNVISVSRKAATVFRQAWLVFMVLATSVPYLVNFASTPAGFRYTWILPPYSQDSLAYMAWSQQAAHGALLFKIKYTALPQSRFMFQPFFLLCGWISRLLGWNIGFVHFLIKEAGVVLFFSTLYRYLDYLELTNFESIVASVLIGISSGAGGLLALLGWKGEWPAISADMQLPEMSTYQAMVWNPLFVYSLLLLLLTIYYLDRGTRTKRKTDLWLAGLSSGVQCLVHPYSQPLLLGFAVVLILIRNRGEWWQYLSRYLAILVPCGIYITALSVLEPVVVQHSSEGSMDSPAIGWYLLGFGIPLLMWVAGWGIERGRWMKQYWQLVLWFGLSLAFAYLPIWFQRKLIFGAHIPLCILAAISMDRIVQKCSNAKTAKWLLAAISPALVPLLALTPIYLLITQHREVRVNFENAYYLGQEMTDGLKYLKEHTRPDDIVLSTLSTGTLIPAFAGNTVIWGHWAMTVDYDARQQWSDDLFGRSQNWDDENRAKKFWSSGIEYIFADGSLKKEITGYPYKWRIILKDTDVVFRNGGVTIYKRRTDS